MPLAPLWGVLFFTMIFTLGLDSQVCLPLIRVSEQYNFSEGQTNPYRARDIFEFPYAIG
jgi:hypothetical protein